MAIALSNVSLLPRYPLIVAGSPERAWDNASEYPQNWVRWLGGELWKRFCAPSDTKQLLTFHDQMRRSSKQ